MFLVFAARKLQLKREINMKNYEQMLISQKYNEATKKVADFQQYMNDAKNMTNIFTQGISSQLFQNQLNGNNFAAGSNAAQIQAATQTASIAANQMAAAIGNVTDSIFQQMNKTQLAKLQAQASSLELRKDALASQVKVLTEEYQAVKSSEDQAAKSVAPEFAVA